MRHTPKDGTRAELANFSSWTFSHLIAVSVIWNKLSVNNGIELHLQ
jgi:hypothetical protein